MCTTIHFTGPVTIHTGEPAGEIEHALNALLRHDHELKEIIVTGFNSLGELLANLGDKATELAADEAADRAAFDALGDVVRAFIGSLQNTDNLTDAQKTQAQAILDNIAAADTSAKTQAADEAALATEVTSHQGTGQPVPPVDGEPVPVDGGFNG